MPQAVHNSAAPSSWDDRDAAVLSEQQAVERALVHKVIWGTAAAVPAATLVCVAMVTIAVGGRHPSWLVWEGMAIFVGALVGTFFGVWAGFVASVGALDEVDHHAQAQVTSQDTVTTSGARTARSRSVPPPLGGGSSGGSGGKADGAVVDEAAHELVVTNAGSNSVSVFRVDGARLELRPGQMGSSPDGRDLS